MRHNSYLYENLSNNLSQPSFCMQLAFCLFSKFSLVDLEIDFLKKKIRNVFEFLRQNVKEGKK